MSVEPAGESEKYDRSPRHSGPPPPYNSSHQDGGMASQGPPNPQIFQISSGASHIPMGVCTVCRMGRIENSATTWTWCMCCFCCFLGIFPGIFAFYCCFRKPKCTICGYEY